MLNNHLNVYRSLMRCLILLFLLLTNKIVLGENLSTLPIFSKSNENFITLDQRHGLGQPSILSMTQDNLGYVWVGTEAGLYRYNGYRFNEFSNTKTAISELATSYISALCAAKNNILWIGTHSGLSRYNYQTGETAILTKASNNIPSDKISSLSCSNDKVFVGTYDNGFFVIDTEKSTLNIDSISNYLPFQKIYQVYQTNSATFIAAQSGVFRQAHSTKKIEKISQLQISSITANRKWIFVASTDGKLKRYKLRGDFISPDWDVVVNAGKYRNINNITLQHGALWVASLKGLHKYSLDGKLIHHYTSKEQQELGLIDNSALTLLPIDNNTLWIGTKNRGISHLNLINSQFGHINRHTFDKEKFLNHETLSLEFDAQKRLWIGTSQGVYIATHNDIRLASHYYPKLKSLDLSIISSIKFHEGSIWFASLGEGILRYNFSEQSIQRYFPPSSKIHKSFTAIKTYQNQIITVARDGDIFKFNKETNQLEVLFDYSRNISPSFFDILPIKDVLWAGTLGDGIFKFKKSKYQQLSTSQGSPTDMIYSVIQGPNNTIWASTDKGILVIDESLRLLKHINKSNGLKSKAVWSLVLDKEKNIWAGTSSGLSKINGKNYSVTNYGILDGIQGLEYIFGATTINENGRIFIGGTNGFNQFLPRKLQANNQLEKIVLTEVIVLGQTVSPMTTPQLTSNKVEFLHELTLDYYQDILSFTYTSLDYSGQDIEYFYRIKGLSEQWIMMNKDSRQFNLMKLPPDNYTIEAYARNSNGVESPIHRLKVNVKAPWWWNSLSKTLYSLILLSLVYWFYRIKKQVVIRLEKTVTSRTKKLSNKNEKLETAMNQLKKAQSDLVESEKMAALGGLVAGVAHEINTPLGIVKTALTYNQDNIRVLNDLVDNQTITASALKKSLHSQHDGYALIASNLERAIHLISTFKQVAVDQSTEAIREINLTEYIKEVMIAVKPLLRNKSITLEVEGDKNLNIESYPGPLYQIFTNLVNNSLIHGFENREAGVITIKIKKSANNIVIIYHDNGNGMSQNIIEHIYEPFLTTKRNIGGSGLGMHIVYNLITQLFKGSIHCESPNHCGVKFTIAFPHNLS